MRDFFEQPSPIFFLRLLKQIYSIFQVEIHSYCLMGNHYHLLLHTPQANLSKAMHYLNGMYAKYFNWDQRRDGPLFRGRYRDKIISEDNQLLQTSFYIHRNPLRANIVENPLLYEWSSLAYYAGLKQSPCWLHTKAILDQTHARHKRVRYTEWCLAPT